MKTIYSIIPENIILSVILLFLNSCDSFVEVDLPQSQLTNRTVFENYATADAALTDIYARIRDRGVLTGTGGGISNQLGNYTDELIPYGSPSNTSRTFYTNTLLSSNTDISQYWNESYNRIYTANSIVEGAGSSESLTLENKKQLQGEAFFIRALIHFYLVNLFGDIPYITDTDYQKNSIVKRMGQKEVYENIIADLNKAISLLPENYSTTSRVRPNKYVVRALLARVYLYNNAFAEAANEASAILNKTELYILDPNIDTVFLINSKETIWQLQSSAAGFNSREGAFFIFTSGPPPNVGLNSILFNAFNSNDLRLSHWIKKISNSTETWYHVNKYKQRENTSTSLEYSILFRLAEQYLIRAEARAHEGDLIGAKEDLNKIRLRAGLSETIAKTQADILKAVLEERRFELFTEYGHRFFDLKRFNELDYALMGVKPNWTPTDKLLPLPQTELSANPNLLPQNAGY